MASELIAGGRRILNQAWANSSSFGGLLRWSRPLLGPKKKGKGGAGPGEAKKREPAAPGADHLFNIFADRKDDTLMEDDKYPEWLWEFDKRKPYYGSLALKFVHGLDIESATYGEYKRFLKKHRKMVIRTNNMRLAKTNKRHKFVTFG